jgi:hypothetical protein
MTITFSHFVFHGLVLLELLEAIVCNRRVVEEDIRSVVRRNKPETTVSDHLLNDTLWHFQPSLQAKRGRSPQKHNTLSTRILASEAVHKP